MTPKTLEEVRAEAEYNHIIATLKAHNNNKSKAAALLKIDRKTLYNKIAKHQKAKSKELAKES